MKLSIVNGSFGYTGKYLFKNLNYSISNGDILAILGPNGVGKTTLLKCIMQMLVWKDGYASLNGTRISSIPASEFWKQVAYVPQAKSSSNRYRVRDMVTLGRSPHIPLFGQPDEKDERITEETLKKLNIFHLADRPCGTLSGGELQMVLIARALAARPQLLIMDEPESNLDFHNQLKILHLIKELSKTITCIINTHYPDHALRISNHAILLMGQGKILCGKTSDIISEDNLRDAFNVDVKIGIVPLNNRSYHYILPISVLEDTTITPSSRYEPGQ